MSVRSSYCVLFALTAVLPAGAVFFVPPTPARASQGADTTENTTSPKTSPEPEVISMSEEEFDAFFEKRKEYADRVFGRQAEYYAKQDGPERTDCAFLRFRSPSREMNVIAKDLTVYALHPGEPQRLRQALPYFPEIVEITLWNTSGEMPDDLWEKLLESGRIELIRNGSRALTFSDTAMRLLSRQTNLRVLQLGDCRVSEKGFAYLENLKNLEYISFGGNVTPKAFLTLAKLPRLEGITAGSFDHKKFTQPVGEEIQQAIASMDGRLEGFGVAEYSYQPVHITVARPLMRMKNLTELCFYGIKGPSKPSDFRPLLEMTQLDTFHIDALTDHDEDVSPSDRTEINRIIEEVRKRAEERSEKLRAERARRRKAAAE